jgi:hypothetical protein
MISLAGRPRQAPFALSKNSVCMPTKAALRRTWYLCDHDARFVIFDVAMPQSARESKLTNRYRDALIRVAYSALAARLST